MRRIFIVVIFFILAAIIFVRPVSAQISSFCLSVEGTDCEEIGKFSANLEKIEKECGKETISVFRSRVASCEKRAEEEKKDAEEELQNIAAQENSAETTLSSVNTGIYELNIEIANSNFSIDQLEREIRDKKGTIKEFEAAILDQKKALSNVIRQIYEYDATSYVEVFLGEGTLSDFTEKLEEMDKIQSDLSSAIKEIEVAKRKINSQKKELEEKQEEKLHSKQTQEYSKEGLVVKQQQQEYLIRELGEAKTPLEQEIARIETEIIELKSAMTRIQSFLSRWLIGSQPSWFEIFSAVGNASSATGVRKSLLLGVLQIESSFGTGLGTPGHYKEYCDWSSSSYCDFSTEALALESICKKYGYNPGNVPMSTACAIGPTQFLPCTWLAYGNGGNPWNLNDAVMATGRYLAANGAASGNERGALFAYNHSSVYGDKVLASATAWQEVINICGFDLDCPAMRERLEGTFGSDIPIE